MNLRERRVELYNEMLEKFDKVIIDLKDIVGIKNVGIGMKKIDGEMTDVMSFKVAVKIKKTEKELVENQIIPKHLQGFRTDVVVEEEGIPLLGTDDLPHTSKVSPLILRGGIQIGNGKGKPNVGDSTGTLGCIATLNDEPTTKVALSNHHVLLSNVISDEQLGEKVGHPKYYESCFCCDCDKIGTVAAFNSQFDCAVVRLDNDINVTNTIEEIGEVKGIAVPKVGDKVLKRGKTTGLTSGEITDVFPPGLVHIELGEEGEGRQVSFVDKFGRIVEANHPDRTLKYGVGAPKFAFHGDSGSVIVNNEDGADKHKIVALLNRIDGEVSSAWDIQLVVSNLNITIHGTPDFDGGNISDSAPSGTTKPVNARIAIHGFEERLKESEHGRYILGLINTHRNEVRELVNYNRAVTVAWHRKQGPAFTAAFIRSAKHTKYILPIEIEGITLQDLLKSIALVLKTQGSDPLKEAIIKNTLLLEKLAEKCESVESLITYLNNLDLLEVKNR